MQFDPQKPNNFIIVDKSEIRKYWHLVRPGLDHMVEEGSNADSWLPEDIFGVLAAGNADLFFTSTMRGEHKGLCYSSREAAIEDSSGFAIVQVLNTFGGRVLHIWIAISNESTNKSDAGSIMRIFNDDLTAIAKQANCHAITFSSNQDWWSKIGPRFDFKPLESKWIKEVK